MLYRLLAPLVILSLLAGCDTQSVEPTCDLAPVALRALPDTTVVLAARSLSFYLEERGQPGTPVFSGNGLRYTATSSDPQVATVSMPLRDEVTVSVEAVGEATIQVTATNTCGQTASQSFTVRIEEEPSDGSPQPDDPPRPDCPSPSAQGEANFLPADVGQTWIYRYEHWHNTSPFDRYEIEGELHLYAIAMSCGPGTRTVTMQQRLVGEEIITQYRTSLDTVSVSAVDEERTVEHITYSDGTVRHPFAQKPVPAYHAATLDTVEVDGDWLTVVERCSFDGHFPMRIVKEVGLVQGRLQCFGSLALRGNARVTLVDFQPGGTPTP